MRRTTRGGRALTVLAMACAVLGLAISVCSAAPADAARRTTGVVYNVDCRAAHQGTGTAQSPWNSLAQVNDHQAFVGGDSILLKRGSTCTGSLHPRGSGRAGAPIVLGAYGAGALPTIAAGGTSDDRGAVELRNQQYWTVQDLHLTNRGTPKETNKYRYGLVVMNRDGGRLGGITVQRLRVEKVVSNLTNARANSREFGGISIVTVRLTSKSSGYDGLQVLKNTVSDVGRSGIVVTNTGYPRTADRSVRISGNRVIRSRGDGIIVSGSIGARIDRNISAEAANFWPCKQCGAVTPLTANAAIWPAYSQNTKIEYNEVYGTHKLGGDGEGIDVDMSAINTVVQYNYVHDNEGGGILFCGSDRTTTRFNIFENNQLGAFTFIGSIPAKNTSIYNNTVYSRVGNDAKVVRTFAGPHGKGITFYNNLIYNMDDSGYYVWPTTPKTRTNTYVGVHGIGEPSEAGKGWTDPGLRIPGSGRIGISTLGGYRPVSPKGDPVGSPVPTSVTKDFFGKKINPRKPPRGAAG